ncbi:DnaJ C-terminal domain-containing protein [Candidatus Phycosocius spiralis]|nr:DnaJ C-terminal domain-containing protein [Candidatus Phycosocius spiralis]
MSSPFAILGIAPSTDPRAAKAAFRAVAKAYHPDINSDPAARQRFEEAREAYRAITRGAASADIRLNTTPPPHTMAEIDLEISIWIAVRGGSVKGSCPLGKAIVRIPAGTRTGDRVRACIGKTEVTCVIRVANCDGYEVEGGNIVTPLILSAVQAKAGGVVDVDTPSGRLRINVPKATLDGDRLLVAGRGLPAAKGRPAGDLYLDIEVIETITDRAVGALERLLALARRPRRENKVVPKPGLDPSQVA